MEKGEKFIFIKNIISKHQTVLLRFILPLFLGIIIGIISAKIHIEYPVRILGTLSANILAIVTFLSPFIIFVSVAVGVSNIQQNKVQFLSKFFLTILITLISVAILTFIISVVADPLLVINSTSFNNVYIDPYNKLVLHFPIFVQNFFNKFSIDFFAVVVGTIVGFLCKPSTLKFYKMVSFEKILYKIIKVIIIPLMPFWIMGSFAATAYSGVASDFFLTDLLLSIFILMLQISFLISSYYFVSLYKKINFTQVWRAGFKIFGYVISLSGVGTSVVIPFIVKEQVQLGVNKNKAQTITATAFNMPGSLIANIVFIIGVIDIFNMNVNSLSLFLFILYLVFLLMIAPSIPGGSMALVAPKLYLLGFNEAMVNLFTTMYYKQGISNAATNNAADIYIGLLVGGNKKDNTKISNDSEDNINLD